MDSGLITEMALWVVQLNQNANGLLTRSPSVSDLIFVMYSIAFLFNRKGRFIAAFLLCEIVGNTYDYSGVGGYDLFLFYAFVYSLLYWFLHANSEELKIRCACAIMVIFEAVVCVDAIYNSEVETYIYKNYEYIVLFIHLYIIAALLPWSRIKCSLVCYYRAIYTVLRHSDAVAYFCYNCKTHKNKSDQRCQKEAPINYWIH